MSATEVYTGATALAPVEGGVSGLVRLAIEQKVPVEVLERLVALQERVTERDARTAFFEALSDFQEKCPEIPKTGKADIVTKSGARFNYTFSPLDVITRTIRPHMKAAGLSYSWDVEPGADGFLDVVCVLRHIDGHAERARFPVPIGGGGRMSAAQEHGAALTYGKRQSLTSVLGLTTTDDDCDGAGRGGKKDEEITDAQAATLADLIQEAGISRASFLKWIGEAEIGTVKVADYPRAISRLNDRIKERREG